ncbi:MAG: FAD-binding oxidoreductase, partial [Acidimicrobiales bacterium]
MLYDPRFDYLEPAAVAYCDTSDDVARCVDFATSHGITPVPRAGGHSYGGYSSGSGLVVDVSRMSSVAVGPGTATIGAGARLIDVYAALAPRGVSIPGGSCPTVGLAGLVLGGGQGVVGRTYGLTCDVLESLNLVTADGTQRRCDPATNADLY